MKRLIAVLLVLIGTVSMSFADAVCGKCGGGHRTSACTNDDSFDDGYRFGVSGQKNYCEPTKPDCTKGYIQGVNDLNDALKGEYTPAQ